MEKEILKLDRNLEKLVEYFREKDILKDQLMKKLHEEVDLNDPAAMREYILSLAVFKKPISLL
jgi:hypothetical protein